MTEYTKGQRVRVVQDTSGHRRQFGDIVTLDEWFPERNQWRIKEPHADTGYRPWLYLGDIEPVKESEDKFEPVEESEGKFKPGDRVDWVYEDGRERADGYWSNVTVVERDDFAGGGEAYIVRRETGDTGLIEASELRLHQDAAPEGYEEVDVDRSEAGDIVTFTYLPTGEVVTTTVHESDFGPAMMGWVFFEDDTFEDFDDDIKVTRVLRKVVPEPEPEIEEPPVGSIVRFENGVYAYRVRRGYTEEFPEDHAWRTLYSDGSTGLDTWESAKRYAGDDGKFEVVREGGQAEDF